MLMCCQVVPSWRLLGWSELLGWLAGKAVVVLLIAVVVAFLVATATVILFIAL